MPGRWQGQEETAIPCGEPDLGAGPDWWAFSVRLRQVSGSSNPLALSLIFLCRHSNYTPPGKHGALVSPTALLLLCLEGSLSWRLNGTSKCPASPAPTARECISMDLYGYVDARLGLEFSKSRDSVVPI